MADVVADPGDRLKYFDYYYNPSRRHTESLATQFDLYEKAYNGESDIQSKPTNPDESWKSYILHKYALQQTHVLAAEVVPEDDPGFTWSTDDEDKECYADVVESLVNKQLADDDYAAKKYESVLKAAVWKSTPVKVSWNTRIGRTVRLTPSGPVAEQKIIIDQPTAELLEMRDFGLDLRARWFGQARFAWHRMRLTFEEIASAKRSDGSPLYTNLDELKTWWESLDENGTQQDYDNDYSGELKIHRARGIEVVEMWTHDRILVRAGHKYMIRDDERLDPIPGLPFAMITLMPSLNDPYGMSLMQILRDPQEHIWTLDNAAVNGLKLMLDPPRAVDIISDPDNADRPWKPGQVYPTSMAAKDAVELLRVQGIDPLVSQSAIQTQRDLMEYISGVTKSVSGTAENGSATESALNMRQSKGRIGKMISSVNRGWASVAKMFLLLDQVFLDYSTPVKLMGSKGAEWVQCTPDMIGGNWNPEPSASSADAVKELTKQNIQEFFTAVQPLQGAVSPSGKAIDWTPMVKKLAELNGLDSNTVIVDAGELFQSQHAQQIAGAHTQAEAQQIVAPPPPPSEGPVSPMTKLIESINYKDLPSPAQSAMLQGLGLPSAGVGGVTDSTVPQQTQTSQNPAPPQPPVQASVPSGS